MKILTQLLNENPKDVFLPEYFSRLPYSRPDAAKEFVNFLNWDVVKKILEKKKSILRIIKDGKLEKDSAEIQFKEAMDYYVKGHTLLLRYAERSHPLLKMLADDFSKSFCTEVDIQLYCTPAGHNAFGWHYDVEEVFILQTKGSKLYTIRPNTIHPKPLLASIPKDLSYENEVGNTFLNVLLVEGDWLYIPSGWWHIARTQAESMHISIGLMPRSAMDVLEFFPQYMSKYSFWRSRLPVHKTFTDSQLEIQYYKKALERLAEELSSQMLTPEFVQEFISFVKSKK